MSKTKNMTIFISSIIVNLFLAAVVINFSDQEKEQKQDLKKDNEELFSQEDQNIDLSSNISQVDSILKEVNLSDLLKNIQDCDMTNFCTNLLIFVQSNPVCGGIFFGLTVVGWLYLLQLLASATTVGGSGGSIVFSTRENVLKNSKSEDIFKVEEIIQSSDTNNSEKLIASTDLETNGSSNEIKKELKFETNTPFDVEGEKLEQNNQNVKIEAQSELLIVEPVIEVNSPVNEIPVLSEQERSVLKAAIVEEHKSNILTIKEAGDKLEDLIKTGKLLPKQVKIDEKLLPYVHIDFTKADLHALQDKQKGLVVHFGYNFYKKLFAEGIFWGKESNTSALNALKDFIAKNNSTLEPSERFQRILPYIEKSSKG